MQHIPYRYRHLPIGGGGYVTGFVFHPQDAQTMYCRTDVGGAYRFDYGTDCWVSLSDHVTREDGRESCPIAVAVDPRRPGRLYIVSGMRDPASKGLLTVSDDFGATFCKHELPVFAHGNLHGRGAGERLCLDDAGTLWLASQADGLWRSEDEGASWVQVEAFFETACTFVAARDGLLLVGTEGQYLRQDDRRGHSLYASFDGGDTFVPVPQPAYVEVPGSRLHGLVAQRCSFDEEHVYVAFSANGARSQNVERGYTCDCGDCGAGCIARYTRTEKGLTDLADITPLRGPWGYSAIDAQHGLLITATIHRGGGDVVYLSQDGGDTWRAILCGLDVGRMAFRLPYMRPECNGGRNLIHWLTDVKLDPHRPGVAWFNTGTGVFRTKDVTADCPTWQDWCDGMEETVHIGVYAPPSGRVQVLDMVGDLGGFAFADIDRDCENSFADLCGNRWITCLSCDWPDSDPSRIIVAARGNWTGETQGGLIVSHDGAKNWFHLPLPMGLTPELDTLMQRIARPNTNAGWVAVSACGSAYVWAVADRIFLHARNVIVSHDGGRTFRQSAVLNRDGQPAAGLMKPLADRCNPQRFYGFGEKGQLYLSVDGGVTFREMAAPEGFPQVSFGLVDCADQTEIRVASGQPGVIYVATGEGLWKLHADETGFTGRRLTNPADAAYCVGLGLGRPGGDYFTEQKAIYIVGTIEGQYGFYRSLDDGSSWQRINTNTQMFGRMHSIDGDCRTFGRFYLATGGRGLVYGEMEE